MVNNQQLSFDEAMKIVGEQKWIWINDIERLEKFIQNQQATIEEYKDFCLNLCKFVIHKGLVDEYREKYGKEYKIITKWWNDE